MVRYVGATSYPLKDRLARHCVPSELKKTNHRTNWINGLMREGLTPIIEELEEYSTAETMFEAEDFWIEYLRGIGRDLVNGANGGKGRTGARSQKERDMVSVALTGKKASEETKKKQSASHKRRYEENPELREWLSKLHTGRKDSPETTERRRVAARARAALNPRPSKRVIHVDTGVIYNSALECAAALGMKRGSVQAVAGGAVKHHRQQQFAYVDEQQSSL